MTTVVTGGTGTIGSSFVQNRDPEEKVRVISRDETKQQLLRDALSPTLKRNTRFMIGDVRDKSRMIELTNGAKRIIHTAAMKHVDICSYNPFQAAQTNIIGTQNIIQAAIENDIENVLLISTDKAVNPTSVMGSTKQTAERIAINANRFVEYPRVNVLRLPNILASRGSVIPRTLAKLKHNKPITITDPEMTRFYIEQPMVHGLIYTIFSNIFVDFPFVGFTFIPNKFHPIKTGTLFEALIEILDKDPEIITTGPGPEEKNVEELASENELKRSSMYKDFSMIAPPYNIRSSFGENKIEEKPTLSLVETIELLRNSPSVKPLLP